MDLIIICSRTKIKEEEFIELDIEKDVYFIDKTKKVITFHSKQGLYSQIVSLSSLEKCLFNSGFRKFDIGNLVNVNLISGIDIQKGHVLFEDGSYTTISKQNLIRLLEVYSNNI
ncbi:LytTR family transcriptional regulator DNA-binding domain-containing protein [Paenibacillus larvae]